MKATALALQMNSLADACRTAERPRTDHDREVLRTAVGTVTDEMRHVVTDLIGDCWEPEHGRYFCPRCGTALKKTPGRHTPAAQPGSGCLLAIPRVVAEVLRRTIGRNRS